MSQFRKKPVVIEAVQFDGSNAAELLTFSDFAVRVCKSVSCWQSGCVWPRLDWIGR